MKRFVTLALFPLLLLMLTLDTAAQDKKDDKKEDPKVALQPFNDYIGSWTGDGKVKKDIWSESIEWGWKFKGDDCWLIFKIKDGKFLKSGELRPLPDKKGFQLTALDIKDNKLVFEGKVEKDYLTLFRTDASTKEQQRIQMFNAGDGIFFNYRVAKAKEGAKLFVPEYEVKAKKDGEVFKPGSKQPLCIVSGGLGTMQVTYKGTTYYVCCSGCRDAFNETPEKFIKLAKK